MTFKALTTAILIIATISTYASNPCKATTKKGQACKGKAAANGYCFAHNPNAKHCTGTTKSGKPCGNKASKGQTTCHLHSK